MLPKTILGFVRENETLDEARRIVALAGEHGCHASFAVVGIALPPPAAVAYAAPLDAWMEERDELQAAIAAKADELEALLQKADVSGDVSQHYAYSAALSAMAGKRARYADLAIVSGKSEDNQRLWNAALKGLLFEGGIPVLYAPAGKPIRLTPETIVVAWSGTLESARAVHASLELMTRAKSVSIAMVDPQENEWDSGDEPGFDIASFLARHGVHADVDRLASGGKEVCDVLLRHARDRDAGLVVMGAYGHSRLREYVFGGTTFAMLEQTEVPVLMMH